VNATACLGCGAAAVQSLLDLGEQPPSNRFMRCGEFNPDVHPLSIGQCGTCALVQLIHPMPAAMVKSRFAWLTYSEPESHLDQLVARLQQLDGISKTSVIRGLTYLDDTTLLRFNRLGYGETRRYDLKHDFGITDECAGLETLQSFIHEDITEKLCADYGLADLFVVRYALEHAHLPARFLQALGSLVKPGGYLVIEVPDCTKFIDACDYSFVWEEHICYYTPLTLAKFIERHGFTIVDALNYIHPLEDSLAVIIKANSTGAGGWAAAGDLDRELFAGHHFGKSFENVRSQIRGRLERLRAQGKHIAVFGASHLAAKFLNFFRLSDVIECVIDDNPHKQGLLMPGSQLPIVGSSVLTERKIDVCLLSLSPESEQKVLAKNQDYVAKGGLFASIFALSPSALRG
jgi:SAM-dependent methyltransferase